MPVTHDLALPGMGTSTLGAGKYNAEDDVRLSVYSPDAADSEPDFVEFTG